MPAYDTTIPVSLLTACLVSALLVPIAHTESSADSGLLPITTPHGTVIMAELADTMDKRAHGLMFRNSLANNRGMLFTFPEPQPWSFWMKNTRISLDIIWMDRSKKIVHIERRVPTCSRTDDSCPQYQPNEDAMYVLELAAGSADALKLQPGTVLRFQAPPAPPIKQPYGVP